MIIHFPFATSVDCMARCLICTVALQKLKLVNGVLFTGGWAKSGLYYDIVERIFKVNNATNYFMST